MTDFYSLWALLPLHILVLAYHAYVQTVQSVLVVMGPVTGNFATVEEEFSSFNGQKCYAKNEKSFLIMGL